MTWFSPEVLCQISMSLVSAQFHHQKEPTFFDDQQKDYGFTVLLNFSIISKHVLYLSLFKVQNKSLTGSSITG